MRLITNCEKGGIELNTRKIRENLISLRGIRTQKEIAEAIGICQSTYAMYEIGQRVPSDENKKKLADFFDTTVQAIFFD